MLALLPPKVPDAYEIPVLVIRILPSLDGTRLDPAETGKTWTLADTNRRIDRMQANLVAMIQEASRYRGYADPKAKPAIRARIVDDVTFRDRPKRGIGRPNESAVPLDYAELIRRAGGIARIDREKIKEVWVWQSHYGDVSPIESNMASPTGLDVSNSWQEPDLPIAKRTYTVYAFNFQRGTSMTMHDRAHQLERLLDHADRRAPESDRIWSRFTGRQPDATYIKGRAGDCHHPPNAEKDYDYYNTTVVPSDIEDWTPEGTGRKIPYSKARLDALAYKWPFPIETNKDIFEGDEPWYVYWMQNFPGRGNRIRHNGAGLRNWWLFMGDFDLSEKLKATLLER